MKRLFKNKEGHFWGLWKLFLLYWTVNTGVSLFTLPLVFFYIIKPMMGQMVQEKGFEVTFDNIMVLMSKPEFLIPSIFIQCLVTTLVIWLFLRVGKTKWADIGVNNKSKSFVHFAIGTGLGTSLISILAIILHATGQISLEAPQGPSYWLFVGIILFLAVAWAEELWFRGYAVKVLQADYKRNTVIIVSSVLFALAHLGNPNASLIGIVNIVIAGFALVVLYEATNSLWLPIGFHFSWNYVQGFVFSFSVSGLSLEGLIPVTIHQNNIWTGGAFGLEGSILSTILLLLLTSAVYLRNQKKGQTI